MKSVRTFKYRVYPTRKQVEEIDFALETSRLLYNYLLTEKHDAWKYAHESRSFVDLCKQTKGNKLLNSGVVRGIVVRVDEAYAGFFRRCKDPTIKKKGYPRRKSKNRFLSLCSVAYPPNPAKIGTKTYFPQIGYLKTEYSRSIKGIPKTIALKKTPTGKYFLTIACEIEIEVEPKPNNRPAVGIDLGLNHAIATSDGRFFYAPKPLKALTVKLKRQSRKFSRTKLRSANHETERIKLARIHERIADIRNDWNHKITTILANTYGTIKVEALNITGMLKNHRLAKSISDVSWGDLINKLSYKAEEAGGKVVKVDPRNTSQECSACGALVPKKLNERTHSCKNCGLTLDRDVNAAKVILQREICVANAEFKPDRENVRRRKSALFSMTQEARCSG